MTIDQSYGVCLNTLKSVFIVFPVFSVAVVVVKVACDKRSLANEWGLV